MPSRKQRPQEEGDILRAQRQEKERHAHGEAPSTHQPDREAGGGEYLLPGRWEQVNWGENLRTGMSVNEWKEKK